MRIAWDFFDYSGDFCVIASVFYYSQCFSERFFIPKVFSGKFFSNDN